MEEEEFRSETELPPLLSDSNLSEDHFGDVVSEQFLDFAHRGELLKSGDQNLVPSKRGRDSMDEEEWSKVKNYGKRSRTRNGNFLEAEDETGVKSEVFLSSSEDLPKQFAFARLMKENNIVDILQIKYINPCKIMIQFANEHSLQNLISCHVLKEKGWRIFRSTDMENSYGVIRNVEVELKEDEIKENITSDVDLMAVRRLKRRSGDGLGWDESECVRLCFGGPSLPSFVLVYGIRVKVEPYTFPVTQCSNCWKFGHPRKMCTKKRQCAPSAQNTMRTVRPGPFIVLTVRVVI